VLTEALDDVEVAPVALLVDEVLEVVGVVFVEDVGEAFDVANMKPPIPAVAITAMVPIDTTIFVVVFICLLVCG
jgi:hypothetical protein